MVNAPLCSTLSWCDPEPGLVVHLFSYFVTAAPLCVCVCVLCVFEMIITNMHYSHSLPKWKRGLALMCRYAVKWKPSVYVGADHFILIHLPLAWSTQAMWGQGIMGLSSWRPRLKTTRHYMTNIEQYWLLPSVLCFFFHFSNIIAHSLCCLHLFT